MSSAPAPTASASATAAAGAPALATACIITPCMRSLCNRVRTTRRSGRDSNRARGPCPNARVDPRPRPRPHPRPYLHADASTRARHRRPTLRSTRWHSRPHPTLTTLVWLIHRANPHGPTSPISHGRTRPTSQRRTTSLPPSKAKRSQRSRRSLHTGLTHSGMR